MKTFLRKYITLFVMILFGYLGQVCIMPDIRIFNVSPNLLYANIAIVTVAYGKLRAFWMGVIYGLLMQIMIPSVSYLNLALYSLTTLFCSYAFADKPLKTLEYDRAMQQKRQEPPAWLRTILCAALNIFVYETVQVTYIYLGGSPLSFGHFFRALLDVFLTTLLTALLMLPLRRIIFGRKVDAPRVTIAPVVFSQR